MNKKRIILWKKIKKLGFYQWSIFDIILISIFSALVVLSNLFEANVHFLPYGGGGLCFKYLFVMIITYLHSFCAGLMVGLIGSLISLIFLGGDLIISPWSYSLDYVLPTMSPSIVAFFAFSKNKNRKIQYLNYFFMVVLSFLLIWFWQTLSGYLIWTKVFIPPWGRKSNGLVYAILFNAISIWPINYPLTQFLFPVIIHRLNVLPWKR